MNAWSTTDPQHGLVFRDLAEIALESETMDVFRREVVSRLARFVGADICSLSGTTNPGSDLSCALFGGDLALLIRHLQPFFGELSLDEVRSALEPKTHYDFDLLSARRRDQLPFYREYTPKVDVKTCAVRLWRTRTGYASLMVARTGRCDQRRFLARTATSVDALFPILVLGERVHAPHSIPAPRRDGSERASLTAAESRVVELLERGLTNREIGSLLGISPNTVRNRVASAFKRVGASRRAELVYLLRTTSASNG